MFELLHLCDYVFTVYMHCYCIGVMCRDDIIRFQVLVDIDFSLRDDVYVLFILSEANYS